MLALTSRELSRPSHPCAATLISAPSQPKPSIQNPHGLIAEPHATRSPSSSPSRARAPLPHVTVLHTRPIPRRPSSPGARRRPSIPKPAPQHTVRRRPLHPVAAHGCLAAIFGPTSVRRSRSPAGDARRAPSPFSSRSHPFSPVPHVSLSLYVDRSDHGASTSSPGAVTRCPITPNLTAAPLLSASHRSSCATDDQKGERQPPPFERSSSRRNPPRRICTRALPRIHSRTPRPPSSPDHHATGLCFPRCEQVPCMKLGSFV